MVTKQRFHPKQIQGINFKIRTARKKSYLSLFPIPFSAPSQIHINNDLIVLPDKTRASDNQDIKVQGSRQVSRDIIFFDTKKL